MLPGFAKPVGTGPVRPDFKINKRIQKKKVLFLCVFTSMNMLPGFAKPVGTGPVRPVPGGTGPARYTNRSGSHPKTEPINSRAR
jgi:hypothetical protein